MQAATSPMKQGGVPPSVPMGVGADGKSAMQDHVMALHSAHHVHHLGDHEEDGSYLELLQNAVGSIATGSGGHLQNFRDGITDSSHRPNM
jgi:hypothetical protein